METKRTAYATIEIERERGANDLFVLFFTIKNIETYDLYSRRLPKCVVSVVGIHFRILLLEVRPPQDDFSYPPIVHVSCSNIDRGRNVDRVFFESRFL